MAINIKACVNTIEAELKSEGFDLDNAPQTKKFINSIVNNILLEVKKGTVTTNVVGSSASGGAVKGTGTGNIN